jgi:prolyl oligopeptidase
VEIREFDVLEAHFVKDGFRVPLSRALAVWFGRDQLLVAHPLFGSPVTAAGLAATVRIWRRGEPLEAAKPVFQASPNDALLYLHSLGRGPGRRAVVVRAIDYNTYDMSVITPRGEVIPLDLPKRLKPSGVLASTDRDLVVQLAEDATVAGKHYAAETLLSVDTLKAGEAGAVRAIYTPPEGNYFSDTLTGVTATRDGVYFVVTRGDVPHVFSALRAGTGWVVREQFAAAAGQSIQIRRSGNPGGSDLIVRTMGLITPTREEIWSPGKARTLVASEAPVMDTSQFVVEARSAISRDKTPIDYVLLRPREARVGTPIPTLMTGYGAFGITLQFGYFDNTVGGRSLALWLARGGALVIPAARGGGERGDNWHRVAMRKHRQLSYDDFAAVAESLVKSGFTTPAHLGIFGSSNGGLMAATLGTQRPDLFGAVISDVPLTDMLRFPKMGMGSVWIGEYGNPDKPDEAAALRAYSPLHNVHANVKYPPFLLTVSTEDNRVGPGHARKLAARLLEVGARVYFIEEQEGGHRASDDLERPDTMAARMTFLIDTLMPHERRPAG